MIAAVRGWGNRVVTSLVRPVLERQRGADWRNMARREHEGWVVSGIVGAVSGIVELKVSLNPDLGLRSSIQEYRNCTYLAVRIPEKSEQLHSPAPDTHVRAPSAAVDLGSTGGTTLADSQRRTFVVREVEAKTWDQV